MHHNRFLVLIVVVLALLPGIALAHGSHSGPIETFTQAIGPYKLAITIEKPPNVPAPLYIDAIPEDELADTRLSFRLAPRGRSFENAPQAWLDTIPGPPIVYTTDLPLDRLGDWELEVRADGPQGSGVARIPFTVVQRSLPLATPALAVALGGLLATLLGGALVSAVGSRHNRPPPAWLTRLFGHGAFACLIAVLILGTQQFTASFGAQPGISAADAASLAPISYGRPHVNVLLQSEPALPEAGRPLTLTLRLSDGSTGLPVDDLDTHHDALMHLVVVSADGGYFAHIHPARIAPGRFVIGLVPDRPGRYSAYIEVVRRDSGTQLITRELEVSGADTKVASFAGVGFGPRSLDDIQVEVTPSTPPIAGRQTTLTFRFSADGKPLVDLQPWLGMAGHLIARSTDGTIFSHVHAAEAMPPPGRDGLSMRYGPAIRFAYTFPKPGSYQVWAQFRYRNQVLTLPITVEVAGDE